jgi:hypothetical protein
LLFVVGDPVAFMVAAKVGRVSLYFKETMGKKGVRERSRERFEGSGRPTA